MNTMLVVITVFAVAVAIAALIALFVAFREDRRRSEARVALLREIAAGPEPLDEFAAPPIDAGDLPIYSDESPAPTRGLFSEAETRSPWGRRIAAAAVTAAIVGAAGYLVIPRSASSAADAPATATGAKTAPLELLSLRHSQADGRLVITGLVQNPRAGVPLMRVIATAFLFSADGTFLASGRAPLDFSTLAPGDESPFVLSVPVTGQVGRYRVGFRSEDGRVIAHVDRRAASTLARTGE
jgi:hypothetical protein